MVHAFRAGIKEGWSLFVGEWFMAKMIYEGMVLFSGEGWLPPSTRVLRIAPKKKELIFLPVHTQIISHNEDAIK